MRSSIFLSLFSFLILSFRVKIDFPKEKEKFQFQIFISENQIESILQKDLEDENDLLCSRGEENSSTNALAKNNAKIAGHHVSSKNVSPKKK